MPSRSEDGWPSPGSTSHLNDLLWLGNPSELRVYKYSKLVSSPAAVTNILKTTFRSRNEEFLRSFVKYLPL